MTPTEAMRLALDALTLTREQLAGDRMELIACHAWPAGSGAIPEHDRAGTQALREYDECLSSTDAAMTALRDALAATPASSPVVLGPFMFQFASFDGWVSGAQRAWRSRGVRSDDTLCIDAAGRICRIGGDFRKARDDNAYPVRVYLMREDMQPAAPKE